MKGSEVVLVQESREVLRVEVPTVFAGAPKAERRFWEFFTTQIANDNTRRAYFKAVETFSRWCEGFGLHELFLVQPIHVATYLKALGADHSAPTVKQHLAAVRMLFDWLVLGHVIEVNPAHAVRGPKHSARKGKTPVLSAEEARLLLDSIAVVRTVALDDGTQKEEPLLVGLRDRALIGLMAYSFARVGAALKMLVEDYYVQVRRGWVTLHEKGGKRHVMPCHHNLERYLEEYIHAAGIANDTKGPLFRTSPGHGPGLTRNSELAETELQSRRGFKRYSRNPSVPASGLASTRMRPVKIPGADKGMLFADGGSGELIGPGVRHFFKFEEVDATRFVKLFLDGMKQAAGLSKAGMAVFELVYRQLQEKPNSDEIALSWHLAKTLGLDIPERTYRHGLRQLLEREFLYESLVDGLYFVNIRYMFNGDRLTFIRGYKLKGASAQAELPLEETLALAAPDAA